MVAIVPITNYPQTTSLNGSETVPGVQAGTTVKIPVSQIASFARTFSPGQQTFGVVTITSAYAVQLTDQVILATNAAGVPTFPTAVGALGQAFIFKNALERLADAGFVVNDEDVKHERAGSRWNVIPAA